MLLPHFVPCQQDVISVRIFACTIAVRAYPTTNMLARFRCAGALRCDGRRASNRFARASFTRAANRPVRVAAQPLQLSAYGRRSMESLRALHQYTSVQQISIAYRAGHACGSSGASGVTTFLESLRTVRGARAAKFVSAYCAAFATRPATVVSLRLFTCQCNGLRAETIAAPRQALVRCAATVEVEVRGSPVP